MDDLNSTISSILSDPAKLEQLRAVAESLGINTGAGNNTPPPARNQSGNTGNTGNSGQGGGGFDPAAIASILQSFQNAGGANQNTGNTEPGASSDSSGNLGSISQIAGILNSFNQSDKNIDLLRSLRPHFSPSRASKIDDAVRIMQLMRVLPSIRDSGLLGGLGNLFTGGGGR